MASVLSSNKVNGVSETVTITLGSSSPTSGKSYEPKELTVVQGSTVTWINNDVTLHTVTSGNPQSGSSGIEFDSSYIAAGKTFQHTFDATGTFDYYCTLHPFMSGTVNVNSPTSTPITADSLPADTTGASKYLSHASSKYHVQFQYPSDWELKEKASRFDEGTDIEVKHISLFDPGYISITYVDDLTKEFGSSANDLQSAVLKTFKTLVDSDYSTDYRVIEPISFTNISGYKAGTFLYTTKDKYKEDPTLFAQQVWVTFVGNKGYLIMFLSPATYFDNQDTAEVRNHFIQSIGFLDVSNSTQTNQPSRFD